MDCGGMHCPGCGHGGGKGVTALVIIVLIAAGIGAAHRAIGQAATDVGHVIVIMLEVIAAVGGLAVASAITYGSVRAVKAVRSSAWYQARVEARRAVPASSGPPVLYSVRTDRPAIAPVRASLADTSWQAEPAPGTVER